MMTREAYHETKKWAKRYTERELTDYFARCETITRASESERTSIERTERTVTHRKTYDSDQ